MRIPRRRRRNGTAVVCTPPLFDPPSNELIQCLSAGLLAHGQCPRSPSRCRFAAFSDVVDRGRSAYSCGGSSGLGDLSPYRIPVSPLARHRKTDPREHDAGCRASADRIALRRSAAAIWHGPRLTTRCWPPYQFHRFHSLNGERGAEHDRPNAIMSEAAASTVDVLVVGGGSAALPPPTTRTSTAREAAASLMIAFARSCCSPRSLFTDMRSMN